MAATRTYGHNVIEKGLAAIELRTSTVVRPRRHHMRCTCDRLHPMVYTPSRRTICHGLFHMNFDRLHAFLLQHIVSREILQEQSENHEGSEISYSDRKCGLR